MTPPATMEEKPIPVAVSGATGRMGLESIRAITSAPDLRLVAAIGHSRHLDSDAGVIAGIQPLDVFIQFHLANALQEHKPAVLVDFSVPTAAYIHAETALSAGCRPIIGTTGLQPGQIKALQDRSQITQLGVAVIPNFAIGAVLMMQMARLAARYFSHAEIIELHHERKLDAPSGTALQTATQMLGARSSFNRGLSGGGNEARGLEQGGLRIHSVRLPGLLAHQEIIFGELGQTLSIRHDTISRECYMPGLLLAIRAIIRRRDFVHGLEHLLDTGQSRA